MGVTDILQRTGLGLALVGGAIPAAAQEAVPRPRARQLGIAPGRHSPGPLNAITDVPGVRVGHVTLVEGNSIRTGVTAVLPHGGNLYREKVRAAAFVGNGFGKLVGTTQVAELGELETPILLTGTLSTFRVADHLIRYMLALAGNEEVRSINPVVGETNDGYLSDIRSRPVTFEHVRAALEGARSGPVAEGCVGAGTGTRCFGWKGGIGTSSRRVELAGVARVVGVLVQTNFGGDLRILGAPVGRDLRQRAAQREAAGGEDGSCMVVIATDAPLDARQLGRLARRGVFGIGRVGASYSHGSGDYALAFSTQRVGGAARVDDGMLSALFDATLEAVEEAVLNSLFCATDTVGRDGHRAQALPLGAVVEICRKYGIDARLPADEGAR